MSNNLDIYDANSTLLQIKTTDNSGVHTPHHIAESPNTVSTVNSTATLLNAAAVFTGTAEDVSKFDSIIVAVKTDQNGTLEVQFSNDGTNWDSTLTRYYRTAQIEAPHRFTITRKYIRVVFTNTSASNQTYLRLQTAFGSKTPLNAPSDSVLSQDFDAVVVRPTDYRTEVALGRRQGSTVWNKFGYNADADVGTEVVAVFGGTFTPMTTARTLSVVSTSANDAAAGTGTRTVTIYGIDANRVSQTVSVTLNGTTPVVTTETWLGVNRVAITESGSGLVNAGNITATATTDATTQAQILAGEGITQQCIFHVQADHTALAEWLTINVVRFGSGTEPKITVKGWVFSAVSNTKFEVMRQSIDVGIENHMELSPALPFAIGEKSVFWLEVTTDRADTVVSGRFSLIEHRDIDA
jgi:hypothetical protein